jgi:hypothetical protein
MISSIRRREFIAGLGTVLLVATATVRADGAPAVISAGAPFKSAFDPDQTFGVL